MKKMLFNLSSGAISQVIILLLGFIVPRIILTHYGSDTNGLTNTITQIFMYMALLEAGIGQAAQNALYPYISTNDRHGMSLIMSAARRYYRKISLAYAFAVLIVSIALPFALKTNVGFYSIFFYTIFEGLTALVGFYYTGVYSFFLFANGKTYIINSINLFVKVSCYGIKIFLAIQGLNIAFIQLGYFIISLIQLVIYHRYMKKHYDWIDFNAAPNDFKLPDRNAYVLTEIASAVFSSTDMIVLSVFVSTMYSSVYSTYNMVFVALQTLLEAVYNSLKYLLGQNLQKGIEKYSKIHDAFNSAFMCGITILVSVAYWFIIPFVKLYTKGVTDINYIYTWLPLCFCLVQILSRSRSISGNLTGIAGYAKPVSYVSLIEAISNAVMSIVLVQFFGIYGVLLATVCALPIKVIYVNYIAEKKIMKRAPWKTFAIFGVNYFVFGVTVLLNCIVKIEVNSFDVFILYGIVLTVIYTLITTSLNLVANKSLLYSIKEIINVKIKR